ncbi:MULTISPECIES: DUF5305 domain-containing protein [Halolamina]|uniref:DUF5305 domain-containing protein n=1 Tax=Halolamina pelagica TaxID=699431 RepID=A0A1I5P2H3_9EURY|nr:MULTISPECIES: DUF5305 domain-containing protein [Halolamina]NHX36596.1 DUF5305 domain-containing protein [Halolamina sp. R1-12]SFP28255.1 hypothetical protein SAMN05216277_102315 [Halolamina pelagica]
MTEGRSRLRGRAIVGSWFVVLAAVLVALTLVGGAAAYTAHVDPGRTSEQVERTHWAADGTFHHAADVTGENPVFPVGSTLSNRSTYYTEVSPELDGEYVLTYTGRDAASASVTLDASLVIQSSSDGTVYWRDRTGLDSTSVDSVAPGESVGLGFALNATEVAERRSAIQSALGDTQGEISTFVVVDVGVAGTVDGGSADLSFTHRLPVSVDGQSYTVGPEEAGSEPMTTTRTVSTTEEYGPFWSLGGPLLFLVGAAGLAALTVGRRRDTFSLSEAERDLLAFRDDRAEFDEWIVRARLSPELDGRTQAEAESLEDVVDFAIDAGAGVVEDPGSGRFYALTEQLAVVYDPPRLARAEMRDGETESGGTAEGDQALADVAGVSIAPGENGRSENGGDESAAGGAVDDDAATGDGAADTAAEQSGAGDESTADNPSGE